MGSFSFAAGVGGGGPLLVRAHGGGGRRDAWPQSGHEPRCSSSAACGARIHGEGRLSPQAYASSSSISARLCAATQGNLGPLSCRKERVACVTSLSHWSFFFQARSLASIFFFLLGAWWDQSTTTVFKSAVSKLFTGCARLRQDVIKSRKCPAKKKKKKNPPKKKKKKKKKKK